MNGITKRLMIGSLILLVAAAVLGTAQSTPAPLGIVPSPPAPQPLTVNIWTNKTSYVVGETATIQFYVSQPAFIYIYDIQPDGVVRLIFPNAFDQANYKTAGVHTLPNANYQFTVAPPTGTEHLQIIASPVNLGLSPPTYYEPFPMAAPNPDAATQKIQVQIMGIVPQPTYASAWTSFQILPAYTYTPPSYTPPPYYSPPPPPAPPPGYSFYPPFYPPFYSYPGATWYWQDGQWYSGVPGSGWYWTFGSDGRWYFRIILRFGSGG